MTTATTLRLLELFHGNHLLRFQFPVETELTVHAGGDASLWISELELGASGSSAGEALEMLSDLIITMYQSHRIGDQCFSSQANEQMSRLHAMTDGLFVRKV